jgi:NADPH:quinone reductase-like Zn-dependent oxidoreductase
VPKSGEVVVDLHAAALNFRDVLMGISMLPELSYQGSYFGRHLGMEAAGIVSAVGPDVADIQVTALGDSAMHKPKTDLR